MAAIPIAIGVLVVISVIAYSSFQRGQVEIDVIRYAETTGGVGVDLIRIKITNNTGRALSNVIIDMGPDDIQQIPQLDHGASIFLTPKDPNKVSRIIVNSDEGISATKVL